MIKFAKTTTFTGVGLLIFAWLIAGLIPNQGRSDFDRLVSASGGQLSHTPTFPDTYIQLSAQRRMLQNFYIAAAGLVCLSYGLTCWKGCLEVAITQPFRDTKRIDPSERADFPS